MTATKIFLTSRSSETPSDHQSGIVMTAGSHHPSALFPKEIADEIRATSAEAERLRDLHPLQLKHIYEQGWFKMFVPEFYGGLGWSLPRVLEVEESLSWMDASTAWVVTLCSGAGWFTGFLSPSLVSAIVADKHACFAGSGAATGIAEESADGFRINGYWKYASGALHATVFTANCVLHKNGRPALKSDGTPIVRAFVFQRNEVILHPHWNSMGMIATGSHSFEVKHLIVPAHRCFSLAPGEAVVNTPVFTYPFLQLAETTLSVNMSGMAMRFIELCELLLSTRKFSTGSSTTSDAYRRLALADADMRRLRERFYSAIQASWTLCEKGEVISPEVLTEVSDASYALAHGSRQTVDALFPYCGLTAADTTQEINRVWRNLHTASQHALFNSR